MLHRDTIRHMPERWRRILSVSVALLLATVPAQAGTTRVLLRAGDVMPDGAVLGGTPVITAADGNQLSFLGRTQALVVVHDGVRTTIATTGDPLPPPLAGAFIGLGDYAINDAGTIVFNATFDAPDEHRGIFLYQSGKIRPLLIGVPSSLPPAISPGGNITYGSSREIHLWDSPTGTSTLIASTRTMSGGFDFRRFRGPAVVNDAGVVVFSARARRERGIFSWDATEGVRPVLVESGLGSLRLDRLPYPLSINADSEVAFVTRRGPASLYVIDVPTGAARLIATRGDIILSEEVRRLGSPSMRPDGGVAFVRNDDLIVVSDDGTRLIASDVPRGLAYAEDGNGDAIAAWQTGGEHMIEVLSAGEVATVLHEDDTTSIGPYVTADAPAASSHGIVVFGISRTALYRHDGRQTELVAAPGDAIPGGGRVQWFGSQLMRNGSLVFLATDEHGPVLLLNRQPRRLVRVAGTGDLTSRGTSLNLQNLQGLEPDEFRDRVSISGTRVAFVAETGTDNRGTGVFRVDTRRDTIDTVAATGDPAPDGWFFSAFREVTSQAQRTFFRAFLRRGDTEDADGESVSGEGIFRVRRGRLTKMITTERKAPGGGTFSGLRLRDMIDSRHVIFEGSIQTAKTGTCDPDAAIYDDDSCVETTRGIFATSDDGVIQIARNGGGASGRRRALPMLIDFHTLTIANKRALWVATVGKIGETRRRTIFAWHPGTTRPRRLLAEGQRVRRRRTIVSLGQHFAVSKTGIAVSAALGRSTANADVIQGILLKRRGQALPLLLQHSRTTQGGTVTSLAPSSIVSLHGNTVIHGAEVDDGIPRSTILATGP